MNSFLEEFESGLSGLSSIEEHPKFSDVVNVLQTLETLPSHLIGLVGDSLIDGLLNLVGEKDDNEKD